MWKSRTSPGVTQSKLPGIIALAPDLVCVAPYNTADSLKLLERSGLSIYRNDGFHTIAERQVATHFVEVESVLSEGKKGEERGR